MKQLALLLAPLTLAAAADTPPDTSLSRHDFLYCGEWQHQSTNAQEIQIVRAGKIVWRYANPKEGEFSDCQALPNGNILVARQRGASEISPAGLIVWNYDAPKGTEVHTVSAMPRNRVLLLQNGNPAQLLLIDKRTNHVVRSVVLSVAKPDSVHGQFRRVRPTAAGTFLVAHMDMGKVVEYSAQGRPIWSVDAPSAWTAVRLPNGNTLIGGNQNGYVREVNRAGKTVWEINRNDLPGIELSTVQEVSRLANGNTLINNWVANLPQDRWATTVQLIEVTPAKKVVWRVSDWKTLGPASATQILDEGKQYR